MPTLSDPLISIGGLGKKTSERLNQLGIYTLEHLLFHLPNRYQDKTRITPLADAHVGCEILVELTIERIEEAPTRQRQLLCFLKDNDNKRLLLRFFHFSQFQKQALVRDEVIQCFGEIKIGRQGLEMHHPEYKILSQQAPLYETTLTPVYPLCQGVTQNKLKQWINTALEALNASAIDDHFEKMANNSMPSLKEALFTLHHPKKGEDLGKIADFKHISQQRLIIEELVAHQLGLKQVKLRRKSIISNNFTLNNNLSEQLTLSLDFSLTPAQARCIDEINADLAAHQPMLRLLQGDVGSGKTIVAVFALLQAVANNFQTAVMAPTEILARQHQRSFGEHLQKLGITIAFLSGSQSKQERDAQLSKVSSGEAQVVIGTHALFQENVSFENLGLIIIDEQHKFGVHQRLSLAQKAEKTPHQLVMTAVITN